MSTMWSDGYEKVGEGGEGGDGGDGGDGEGGEARARGGVVWGREVDFVAIIEPFWCFERREGERFGDDRRIIALFALVVITIRWFGVGLGWSVLSFITRRRFLKNGNLREAEGSDSDLSRRRWRCDLFEVKGRDYHL